ncbi:hypothetical protein M758_8G085300 [Ceratodon purpureus]|nr:hypothetical protein M758_8G085300 [Ceratodon purpureus]
MAVMAAGLTTSTPFLCLSSTLRQEVHTCSGSPQVSFWRSDLTGGFSLSHRSSKAASQVRQFKGSRFVRAAQSSAKNEADVTDDNLEITKARLRELSESLVLPANYLERLPSDLRVDLKDAAFALSNGTLSDECGEQAGALLMQLSRTWESGDTQGAAATAKQLPTLLDKLTSESSSAFVGRRCIRAGRYFTATGQYEGGELQKIGKALIALGEAFSRGNLPVTEAPVSTAKTFKVRFPLPDMLMPCLQ